MANSAKQKGETGYKAARPQDPTKYWDFVRFYQGVPPSKRKLVPVIEAYIDARGADAPNKSTLKRWAFCGAIVLELDRPMAIKELAEKIDCGEFDPDTGLPSAVLLAKTANTAVLSLLKLCNEAMKDDDFKKKLKSDPKSMVILTQKIFEISKSVTRPAAGKDLANLSEEEAMQVVAELMERHPPIVAPIRDVATQLLNGK